MEGGPSIQEVDNDSQRIPIISSQDSENERGCYFTCCHPRGSAHRFVALFFMCLLGFGSYFCYDNPSALEKYIKKDLNINVTQYSLLYSVYSWPNVVLCFVGGFLIDRVFGVRLGANIYMGLTLLGQVIFATGSMFDIFWIMLVGRFIFGVGAESLAVAQNNYAILWFKGKEVNMIFGLQLSIARVGSAVNFLVMVSIYQWVDQKYHGPEALGIVLYLAALTCLISMVCSLILGYLDMRAEKLIPRRETASAEPVQLTDIKYFNAQFWLITAICITYYVAIFPFIGLSQDFFISRFHITEKKAGYIISTIYLLSACISPGLGLLVDKFGKNIYWIGFAVLSTILAHSLLAFTTIDPTVGMVILGISYSCLACSLWPLVALVIPEHQLGTAFGVCQAIQNFGLAVFTILSGIIVDNFGYTWMEVFFISSLWVAFMLTIALLVLDKLRQSTLNMTPGERTKVSGKNNTDREALISEGNNSNVNEGLVPSSDFQIRNRYLSRIGAPAGEVNE